MFKIVDDRTPKEPIAYAIRELISNSVKNIIYLRNVQINGLNIRRTVAQITVRSK